MLKFWRTVKTDIGVWLPTFQSDEEFNAFSKSIKIKWFYFH